MLHTLVTARGALEAARGTRLDPTRKLYFGSGLHNEEVATIRPLEQRASYFESYRAYPGIRRDSMDFGGDVTFEDLPWWLSMHVKGGVAGAPGAVGDESAITWSFMPAAATDDLKSATFQWGATDGPTLWELAGLLGEEFSIAYKKGDELKWTSKLLTAAAATQIAAFTGVATERTTITALGTLTKVYIDDATIGTTEDDVEEATFKLTNGFVHRDALDGTNTAKELKRPMPRKWTLDVQRYFATKGELDAYLAKGERKVRVETTGPVIAGTASSVERAITLDCYGVWDKHAWTEVDGLIYAQMTLVPLYDTAAGTDFSFQVVNDQAAIS